MSNAPTPIIESEASDRALRARALRFVVGATAAVALLLAVVVFLGLENARLVGLRAALRLEEKANSADLSGRLREARFGMYGIARRLPGRGEETAPEELTARFERAEDLLEAAAPPLEHPDVAAQWEKARAATKAFLDQARIDSHQITTARQHRALDELMNSAADELRATADAADRAADEREDAITARALRLQQAALILVLACAGVTLAGSAVSARFVTKLFHRLESNKEAMTRISGLLLEKQEEAAQRFSQELHDELGQNLTALKADLRRISRTESEESFDERKQRCLEILDQTISATRNLSQLLHPRVLDDLGLASALEWLAEGFSERTGISVEQNVQISHRLAPGLRHQLFRIAQEALTNIARHSGATKAGLFLTEQGVGDKKIITLRVTDNGTGLSSTSMASSGLGLAGMRARALMVGGVLKLDSNGSDGVKIEVTAPAVLQDEQTEDYSLAG